MMEVTPYSANWLSQIERYPFILDPNRTPGIEPMRQLSPDIQGRMEAIKQQLALIAGVCACRINNGSRISIVPDTQTGPFTVSSGSQFVIDLQTGHLYLSADPLPLAKQNRTDWQYFLQFGMV